MAFVVLLFKDLPQDPSKFAFAASFLIAALVAAGFTAFTVPQWHRERSAQMDAITGRVAAMVAGVSDSALESTEAQSQRDLGVDELLGSDVGIDESELESPRSSRRERS